LSSTIKWHCKKCPVNKNEDCGPWEEDSKLFKSCKKMHEDHDGWQITMDGKIESLKKDPFQSMINSVLEVALDTEEKKNSRIKTNGRPIEQIERYLNTIIANDMPLIRKLVRVGLSAYGNDPINLAILAPTSEGKTYTAVKVLELFPKEDVIFVGRMSPSALVHDRGILVNSKNEPIEDAIKELNMKLNDEKTDKASIGEIRTELQNIMRDSKKLINLSGKIMLFLDSPHMDLWDRLKPILSHDKQEIEFKITEKDRNGGFRTSHIVIKGWPSCIFCSAKNEKRSPLWGEIESRFVIANPNMDSEKYKQANRLTGMKKGLPRFAGGLISSQDDEKWARFYIQELKLKIKKLSDLGNPIWNPFHSVISETFPNSEGTAMRNYNRFTSFCNIETLLNSDYNFKIIFKTKDGKSEDSVIMSLDDISRTIDVIGLNTTIPEDKIKFVTNILEPLLNEQELDYATSDKLAAKYSEVYHKSITPKKVLENYLYPLLSDGIIDFKENPEDKRQKQWRLVTSLKAKTFDFIKSKIIEESKNNDLLVWSGVEELERCSIDLGRIIAIIDRDGMPTGHNLIQKEITGVEPMGSSNNFMEAYA
jgi:hypothetical protein